MLILFFLSHKVTLESSWIITTVNINIATDLELIVSTNNLKDPPLVSSSSGNHYIYKILDWKKPDKTTLVVIGTLLFSVILHVLFYLLYRIRVRIYSQYFTSSPKLVHNGKHDSSGVKSGYNNNAYIDEPPPTQWDAMKCPISPLVPVQLSWIALRLTYQKSFNATITLQKYL